jgi:UDP-GlcNAc3NAcA epimerase
MKLVTVIGARPQFIKAATISRAIKEYNQLLTADQEQIVEVLVHQFLRSIPGSHPKLQ